MNIIKGLSTPFFLTGGTALSRHYFPYRYSDDLDLFLPNDPDHKKWTDQVLSALIEKEAETEMTVERESIKKFRDYAQVFIRPRTDKDFFLKIDLVNDTVPHYGGFEFNDNLGWIDSWRNILSNKLGSLFRSEPKDLADIWIIAKHCAFDWMELIQEAKTKEAGVEAEVLFDIIKSFPIEKLNVLRWVHEPDKDEFQEDLDSLAYDLFYGRKNSLSGGKNSGE